MKFCTKIRAIDPKDGQLKTWFGPDVTARTKAEAEEVLQASGRGYAEVLDQHIATKNAKTGEDETDFVFWN